MTIRTSKKNSISRKMDDIPHASGDASPPSQEFDNASRHSELVKFLTQSSEMRSTARSSLKQSLYAGSGAFAGSILAGPIGGLAGGIVGSVAGYIKSDEYDGVIQVIRDLEEERRDELILAVGATLTAAGASIDQLSTLDGYRESLLQFAEQGRVRDGLWKACVNSMRS